MPSKKKKLFNKNNSVKFLLIRGNDNAQNADGKTLENVLVPVSNNYKAGSSLLLPHIKDMCNSEDVEIEDVEEEPDLKEMLDQFSDEDEETVSLQSGLNRLCVTQKVQNFLENVCSEGNTDDDFEVDGQYSDASDDFFDAVDGDSAEILKNCPENLQILNARFEKVLEEYDDEQIGALDDEEITGYLSTDCERVQSIFKEELNPDDERIELGSCEETIKEKILYFADDSGDEEIVEIVKVKPLEFDCESILSTYSNQYNHPTVIKEDTVKKKRSPKNPLIKGITKSQLKTLEENKEDDESDIVSINSRFNIRNKSETPEEKRERKSLFKEAKRESRMMKKENKLAFKEAKKKQIAQNLNVQNTRGTKLL